MNKAAFHSAGRLDVEMFINRFRIQRFVFVAPESEGSETLVPVNILAIPFRFVIKENEGAIGNILSIGMGFGLSYPVYETNVLDARLEATQTNIQQGTKYWFLERTDTGEIWLNGHIDFSYGPLSSAGSDQDVTVNVSTQTITVQLQSIVYVNTTGGDGGSFEIVDYTAFESDGLPSGVEAGYIARLVFVDPDYQQTINGVQYYNNKIIYYNGTRWLSWTGDAET